MTGRLRHEEDNQVQTLQTQEIRTEHETRLLVHDGESTSLPEIPKLQTPLEVNRVQGTADQRQLLGPPLLALLSQEKIAQSSID
jgi:hypothetical protein